MLCQRIKNYIKVNKLKQSGIAAKLGMSKQCFHNKLEGRSRFTAEEYIDLCHVLDLDPNYFDSENNVAAR